MSNQPEDPFGTPVVACKFPKIGDGYKGITVISWSVQQQTKQEDGELVWWDKEKTEPKNEVVVVVDTDERDSWEMVNKVWVPVKIEDDDGRRSLFVKGGLHTAVKAALQAAKSKFLVGAKMDVFYTADGTASNKSWNPPKKFEVTYTPPEKEDPFAV